MIELSIQLKMISFSFCYGIFFYFVFCFIKPLIYNKKFFFVIFLFGILNGVLYFFLLKIINDGILNINLLFLFLFGFLICKALLEKK